MNSEGGFFSRWPRITVIKILRERKKFLSMEN
jgi:hypothetical protein